MEIGGKRHTLRVGDAPASVGGSGGRQRAATSIVLTAGSGGHFMTQGAINGRAVQFMVDTGATSVAMGVPDAERLGLTTRPASRAAVSTANGTVHGLAHEAGLGAHRRRGGLRRGRRRCSPQPMPYILLGNSFLTRFQMKRDNDQMVLERRY